MTAKKTTRKKPIRQQKVSGPRGPIANVMARIVIWCLITILSVAIIYGIFVGLRVVLFTKNAHFTLETIDVEATPNLRKEGVIQILEEMGITPGHTNLFELHLTDIRERLEGEVVVSIAEIGRLLPDTLTVRIYERSPVAKLRCNPRFLIDEEGLILPYWETRGDSLLPEITGIQKSSSLTTGTVPGDPVLTGACDFLKKIRSRPEGIVYDVALIQLDYYLPSLKIHLRKRDIFRGGAIIVVPIKDMDAALDRLRDIVRLRAEDGKTTSFIDVTYEKNCPVRS